MDEVDLDQLSASYAHRPIGVGGEARVRLSCHGLEGTALDLGGGTGAHADVMRACGLAPIVVDRSKAMCNASAARGLPTVRGTSERLPFRSSVAALAYLHLSIHYGDWRMTLDEAARVVVGGGRIEIWTFDREGLAQSSLARWFPSVPEIDGARFPDPAAMSSHLEGRGIDVTVEAHPERVSRRAGDWVAAVRARFVSTLQLVPDAEIESGIARFLQAYPDPESGYEYTLRFLRISGSV